MRPILKLPRRLMLPRRAGLKYDVIVCDAQGREIDREMGTPNLIPIEGLTHALGVLLEGVTPITLWYIGIFEGNYTPASSVTAASLPALATECVAYSETTRREYIGSTVVAGANDNSASLGTFTSTADKTIYGAFLSGSSGKASTGSVILSIVRFASPKTFPTGGKLYINASPAIASA